MIANITVLAMMSDERSVKMMDREKVINGLETIKQFFGYCLSNTSEIFDSYYDILNDAIVLLKEQETKAGTWQWKIHGKAESGGTLGEAVCDQCGKSTYATAVKGDLNYCPNCGAKMED